MRLEESLPVFYLSADLGTSERFSPMTMHATELRLIGHFYIRTEDDLSAGARAADICRNERMELIDYLSLPFPINEEQIREFEPEHQTAYETAIRDGEAVVVSVVFGPFNP